MARKAGVEGEEECACAIESRVSRVPVGVQEGRGGQFKTNSTKASTHREEILVGGGSRGVERQVEELRHNQADHAEHGDTAVLDLPLLAKYRSAFTLGYRRGISMLEEGMFKIRTRSQFTSK